MASTSGVASPSALIMAPHPVSIRMGVRGDSALMARATMVAVHVGHAQIGDDDLEGPAVMQAGTEHFQALATPRSDADFVMIVFQTVVQEFAHAGFIVNAEDAEGEARLEAVGFGPGGWNGGLDNGEDQPDAGALARRAFNFNGAFVALHHAVNHGQSEAGSAALPLGGEERFQTMLADFFIHARTVVAHFQLQFLHRRRRRCPRRGG